MSDPFIPFPNCAEVVCFGVLASQDVLLTNGVRKASAFSGTDLQDIADIFANWLSSTLLLILSDDLVFNSVKATDLTTQFSPVAVSVSSLPTPGSITGIPVANNTAAVISYATAQRGRPFRGRNYVPGVPSAALQTTSEFTTTFQTDLASAYSQLGLDISTAGFNHVVLSRQENNVRRTTGVATAVTSYLARTPIGTQRRRVIGHGS